MPLTEDERQGAIRYAEVAADVCRQGTSHGGTLAQAVIGGFAFAAFGESGLPLIGSAAASAVAQPRRVLSLRGDPVAVLLKIAESYAMAADAIRGGAEPLDEEYLDAERAMLAGMAPNKEKEHA